MTTLAKCGSRTLEQHDRRLYIVDHETDWTPTARFVLGLLTLICGANAVLMGMTPSLRNVAYLLGPLALVFAAMFIAIGRYRAQQESTPGKRIITIDLDHGLLNDRDEVVAPLSALSVRRVFQLTSSSKALELRWPNGAVEVARGNPFADDVGEIEHALRQLLHVA